MTETKKDPLPADVVRLVIAARVAAFEDHIADPVVRRELDQASEAFADRVPWEDDPNDEAPEVDASSDIPVAQEGCDHVLGAHLPGCTCLLCRAADEAERASRRH